MHHVYFSIKYVGYRHLKNLFFMDIINFFNRITYIISIGNIYVQKLSNTTKLILT